MKSFIIMLAWIFVIGWACLAFSSCVTTTTTAKDGSVTITKAPAPGVLPFAADVLRAYSPRAIPVADK